MKKALAILLALVIIGVVIWTTGNREMYVVSKNETRRSLS